MPFPWTLHAGWGGALKRWAGPPGVCVSHGAGGRGGLWGRRGHDAVPWGAGAQFGTVPSCPSDLTGGFYALLLSVPLRRELPTLVLKFRQRLPCPGPAVGRPCLLMEPAGEAVPTHTPPLCAVFCTCGRVAPPLQGRREMASCPPVLVVPVSQGGRHRPGRVPPEGHLLPPSSPKTQLEGPAHPRCGC